MREVELTLKECRHEYGPIYTFLFTPAEQVQFTAGQYAHFRLPELSRQDLPVREFSFASAPEDSDIAITVNTRSGTAYQKALLALLPGEKVILFGIYGEMTMPEEVGEKVVCVSHGVGAAPFRSIIRHMAVHGRESNLILIQIDHGDYLYQAEFEKMHFPQKRITRDEVDLTLEALVNEQPSAHYFVAGSPTFAVATADKLAALGVPSSHLKRDVFNGLEE